MKELRASQEPQVSPLLREEEGGGERMKGDKGRGRRREEEMEEERERQREGRGTVIYMHIHHACTCTCTGYIHVQIYMYIGMTLYMHIDRRTQHKGKQGMCSKRVKKIATTGFLFLDQYMYINNRFLSVHTQNKQHVQARTSEVFELIPCSSDNME